MKTPHTNLKSFVFIILLIAFLMSCKKKDIEPCEKTMAEVAGTYKITKKELVPPDQTNIQNITSTLTSCELSGIYHLNTDSTATYTESAGCSGNSTGHWNCNSYSLYISFNSGGGNLVNLTSITSWDCTNLVVTTMFPGPDNYRFTLTRF